MIIQPATVELTKIHYYDKNPIPTISREVFNNQFNANAIIKKNVFGHRWVLKISEEEKTPKKSKLRVIIYVLVFCCIIIAVSFGLFFSFEQNLRALFETTTGKANATEILLPKPSNNGSTTNEKQVLPTTEKSPGTIGEQQQSQEYQEQDGICKNCSAICLKLAENDVPQCRRPLDGKDPTGCGGYCSVNTQYCQLLDVKRAIFQCSNVSRLKCPEDSFNCGNRCIPVQKRCDGVVHCSNKSDEIDCDCNLETHFQCGNSTACLDKTKRCDGIVDCWDKSDEIGCKTACKQGTLPCLSGECIPKQNFCDGTRDCEDGSDEPQGCQLF